MMGLLRWRILPRQLGQIFPEVVSGKVPFPKGISNSVVNVMEELLAPNITRSIPPLSVNITGLSAQ